MDRHAIPGSEREPVPGAKAVAPADPNASIEATVVLKRRSPDEFGACVRRAVDAWPGARLSRDEFANRFSADPADCSAVRAFAKANGLQVAGEDTAAHTIRLSGTVAAFSAAFGVELHTYDYHGGSYRGRVGSVHVPESLASVVVAVLGLDDRPQASPHFRIRKALGKVAPRAQGASFDPVQIAKLYGFPAGAKATGQCIAVIELGGGYKDADLQAYFSGLGVPVPEVVAVSVDSAQNAPTGSVDGPDGEVMLDIEVAGAVATGAKIAVYFAPNTDAGFLDAITAAIHDTTNKPSVISISWGSAESTWTKQATAAFDAAFQAAATLGITVTAASGDSGSSDGQNSGNHADFPCSSSYALACGGTKVAVSGQTLSGETVWNETASDEGATGGGVSAVFALPAWQKGLSATSTSGVATPLAHRGVPDVAGNADPETGYAVRIDGTDTVLGGTSAVAPLWAALIALANAAAGTNAGFINAKLYADASVCRDITQGNNGAFEAVKGWDACTGLGSPNGAAVVGALATNKSTVL
ncbi:MAG TPA: S53 family peptidase [Candidatus Tumulicola sp.]